MQTMPEERFSSLAALKQKRSDTFHFQRFEHKPGKIVRLSRFSELFSDPNEKSLPTPETI